jgi:nitrite reductase/ring-hydroxylating ferredoxin subunit
MERFVRVAAAGEIPPGHAKAVVAGNLEVAVFNVEGAFYAVEASCPHQGGPLAEGWIEGPVVTCPWHAWSFDVRTGEMTMLGSACALETYETNLVGSEIYVCVDPRR